jgi:GNAT superfamily N-acetyltransferase
MRQTVSIATPVPRTFRASQTAGIFDLPPAEISRQTFEVELPGDDEDWRIGLIVGPSGSGKTTVAREVLGERLYTPTYWPRDAAVVDGFGDRSVREVTQMLTAVGLGSPPAWIRPYHTLSNGERFRCDLARALLCSPHETVAFDEFTSVVDRTVAKIGSAAVAKAIRGGRVEKRFIAVTCHYDVLDWLTPDWTLDMATQQLARGCLQQGDGDPVARRRPEIKLEVRRCTHREWPRFARHHYLSGSLASGARCYLATWNETPVAFLATLLMFGFRRRRRVSRLVTLPDYQGIGVGARLLDAVCELEAADGHRLSITTSHPAMIRYCEKRPNWRRTHVSPAGSRKNFRARGRLIKTSVGRATVSFEFVGPSHSES